MIPVIADKLFIFQIDLDGISSIGPRASTGAQRTIQSFSSSQHSSG
jgi:hypothetical protein